MTKQITNIAQFQPLPKSRGKIGMYICEAPNTTEAYAGEYSVRITFNGCAINAKTTLAINSCDNLYIKAFNPLTNVETNKLIRKPNVAAKNEYEDLILQVETLDGKIIKTMDYAWTPPAGVTLVPNPNEPYKRQTNKLGRYTVQARSANGTNCPLSIDIFAEPCTIVGDAFNCNGTGGSGINAGQADLANLAVGDEFTTSDYTIVVTEASGSSTGWTGKGKLIFNFLKISNTLALQIPISVTFTGIKINQCYQLYSGTVVTEYDPSWGSIANLGLGDSDPTSELIAKMVAIQDDIVGRMDAFTGSAEDTQFLNGRIAELNKLKTDITASTIDAEVKTTLLEQLEALISYASCSADPTNTQGARVSAMQSICSLNPWVALAKCLGSASLDIFGSYAFKWVELKLNGNPKSFTDYSGITSQMDWSAVLSSATVSCVFSVIPIPTGKTALAAMAGASGLAAAEAFSLNVLTQYNSLRNTYSNPSTVLRNINWSQSFLAAGGAGSVTFISTALIRASSHPAVTGLKNSIINYAKSKGASQLRAKFKELSTNFTDDIIDRIFTTFGIKGDLARSLLPDLRVNYKNKFSATDFANAETLPLTVSIQSGKTFAQSAEDLVAALFTSKGMQRLESKIGGDNGFDILLVDNVTNPKQVIVIEVKSSTTSPSHSATMNNPVNACVGSGENQMSWCWLEDVVRRMLKETSKPNVISNAEKIEKIIKAGKAERYIVSVNNVGEAKILGI